MRGEDTRKAMSRSFTLETPPRAWGRQPLNRKGLAQVGNTPTCVGKTNTRKTTIEETQKHPHVRGEDSAAFWIIFRVGETPPRAWGRRQRAHGKNAYRRNTPTCVGKTPSTTEERGQRWKHPHVRGEDLYLYTLRAVVRETPPRAWGRHCVRNHFPCSLRNTPTCVGTTHDDEPHQTQS